MSVFSKIIIIYNPNSTGHSKDNAESFAATLSAAVPTSTPITTIATTHAGHAEQLTRQYADESDAALVISSSGDGGYHEVINGSLAANHPVTTGLLPSGNANDHYHAIHQPNTIERIAAGDVSRIDVLNVSVTGADPWQRYAHSYVGIGLTPQIGEKLTKADLNPFNEVWLVLKHLFTFSPVKIRVDDHARHYDSLIASTIPKMSKIMNLSPDADATDGKFELTTKRSTSLIALLTFLLRSIIPVGQSPSQYQSYQFTVARKTSIQLDGEVYHCAPGSTVTISCEQQKLAC
ncbi:MAG: diacylglycerol kinase family protein, partial [Candidatus Saccharimonadales bacterium]